MRYPRWIPYPSSVLNALLLSGLMSAYFWLLHRVTFNPWQLRPAEGLVHVGTLVLVLGIVLPVLYVTLIHHGIKLLLTVCLPKLQKTGKTQGFKPGLMSWWEGFWGLWVTFTATVSTLCLCMMFYSGPISCSRIAPTGCSPDGIEQASRFGVFAWLVIASYLYQLHHLVEERLIKVNSKES